MGRSPERMAQDRGRAMKLYTFFQSGSAYRVRIALALKQIDYEPIYVVGGLGSTDLKQLEYLEETCPEPPLLPSDNAGRARVRAMAQVMVSDTHPLSPARVIDYLDGVLGLPKENLNSWLRQWNERGFAAVEKILDDAGTPGTYCHGDTPTVADIALRG
jgi:glutathione S-transferase